MRGEKNEGKCWEKKLVVGVGEERGWAFVVRGKRYAGVRVVLGLVRGKISLFVKLVIVEKERR